MINENEFINELEGYLLSEEAKELEIGITGEEEETPVIDSPQKANFFLKLIKNIDEDMESINNLCDEEITKTTDRVNTYREAQLSSLANQKEYFLKILKNYTEAMFLNSKKKNIKLPNGTLAMTKQQPLWEYEDDEIISYLKQHNLNDLLTVEVKEKINKKDLKKSVEVDDDGHAVINGEVMPGIKITTREDKFTVK